MIAGGHVFKSGFHCSTQPIGFGPLQIGGGEHFSQALDVDQGEVEETRRVAVLADRCGDLYARYRGIEKRFDARGNLGNVGRSVSSFEEGTGASPALCEIPRHVLRVFCRRCQRIVEIQKADAVRLYGPRAVWKGDGQRLLDSTCTQRTGRHEEDGCWPTFEQSPADGAEISSHAPVRRRPQGTRKRARQSAEGQPFNVISRERKVNRKVRRFRPAVRPPMPTLPGRHRPSRPTRLRPASNT